MAMITPEEAGGKNVCAYLDMIAVSEGTAGIGDDGYNVMVGGTRSHPHLFTGYAKHPNIYDAATNSTAAGRYQLLGKYWPSYKQMLNLSDFGPVSQDKIAIQQIRECGALGLVQAGKFAQAVAKTAHIWASLPGNNYGQHQNPIAQLQSSFVAAGGVIAA